jgi:hypothetical protein
LKDDSKLAVAYKYLKRICARGISKLSQCNNFIPFLWRFCKNCPIILQVFLEFAFFANNNPGKYDFTLKYFIFGQSKSHNGNANNSFSTDKK